MADTERAPADPPPSPPKETPPNTPKSLIEKVYTPEQIAQAPSLFGALGMAENRRVLWALAGMSLLLVAAGFGVFLGGREIIPIIWPSISRYDSPIYACGAAVVVTQAIIFAFYFWAWKHDVEEEKQLELKQKTE